MIKKLLFFLFFLNILNIAYAEHITPYFTYEASSTVTSTNLNGNFNRIINEFNGSIDNTNIDTSAGFRFFEVLGATPPAGQQGRIVYNSTLNSLNFDTGSEWNLALIVTPDASVKGDLLYYDGTDWVRLNAGNSGEYLQTMGNTLAPKWNPILPASPPTIFLSAFAGDASDGEGPSTTSDISNTLKQYNNWTVNAGQTITAQNCIIAVKGKLTVNGTISANGGGYAGGAAGSPGVNGTSASAAWQLISVGGGGGGGGGGAGPAWGGAGGTSGGALGAAGNDTGDGQAGGVASAAKQAAAKSVWTEYIIWSGVFTNGGGAGGGGGGNTNGGTGGTGGGYLIIECEEFVGNAASVVSADGAAGANASQAGSGGAGGGGGGFLLIRARTITANAGTIRANGGAGGTSPDKGDGGAGGAGLAAIIDLP